MNIVSEVRQELSDLCETLCLSKAEGAQRRRINDYLIKFIAYPDEGSEFDKKIGIVKYLFRKPIIKQIATYFCMRNLRKKGYDFMLLSRENEVLGHIGFQVHKDNTLHVFSILVNKKYRGKGLARYMGITLIEEARTRNIDRIRMGAGGHEATVRIYDYISRKEQELNVKVKQDYWIKIM